MARNISIDVCVDSVASAIAAERGGADRIELCGNLHEGGTTPSAGMIEVVRSRVATGMHIMIRPRGGDFCYSEEEFEIMRRDLRMAKNLGADGVVLGVLRRDGSVDVGRTGELAELARPLKVTFHRAFDCCFDLMTALENVIETGADRILTSGGKRNALEALQMLSNLVASARGRTMVMACGRITAANAPAIIRATRVKEIHVGLRRRITEEQISTVPIPLGVNSECDPPRFRVVEGDVRDLRRAVDAL